MHLRARKPRRAASPGEQRALQAYLDRFEGCRIALSDVQKRQQAWRLMKEIEHEMCGMTDHKQEEFLEHISLYLDADRLRYVVLGTDCPGAVMVAVWAVVPSPQLTNWLNQRIAGITGEKRPVLVFNLAGSFAVKLQPGVKNRATAQETAQRIVEVLARAAKARRKETRNSKRAAQAGH